MEQRVGSLTGVAAPAVRRSARAIEAASTAAPVLLTAAGCLVAAAAALPAYQVAAAPADLLAAAGGSAVISLLSAGAGKARAAVSYGASLAGLIVLLLAGSGFQPVAVLHALERGPNRVISETLPIGGGFAALSPLIVVLWLCSAACGEILLRSPASTGSLRGRVALVVPVLLFALCFAVASGAPRHDRWGAPVLLALLSCAAVLLYRQAAPAGEAGGEAGAWLRHRPPIIGVAAAGAAAAALAAAAPVVPSLSARPAALHRSPPVALPALVDPVAVMAQLRDGRPHQAPQQELAAHLDHSSTGYMALAELDTYDGAHWRFTATFEPTGGRIPRPAGSSAAVDDVAVTQTVDLTGPPPEPLLAAIDRPVSVAGPPVVTDASTGMLLPRSAVPHSYTVVSDAPAVTLAGIPQADGLDPAIGTNPGISPPATMATARNTPGVLLAVFDPYSEYSSHGVAPPALWVQVIAFDVPPS